MANKIFIIGAGGMGRETLDVYDALGRASEVSGFLEENCRNEGSQLNGKTVHDISFLDHFSDKKPLLIGAMGSTKRRRLLERLEKAGYQFDSVISPRGILSKWVEIGDGCILMPGTILTCQVKVGRHVIMNCGATISHDVTVGSYSTLSPGARIMGLAKVGEEVFLGANATVADRITIGRGAIVAAGAVVVEDVPEMALVAGVPAVVKKLYHSQEEKPW